MAKVYLLRWHDLGQQPFASITSLRQTDATDNRCQEWLAMNYKTHAPVVAMATRSGLPERSFSRTDHRARHPQLRGRIHELRSVTE